MDEHMPKVGRFGTLLSMMVAAGFLFALVRAAGSTVRVQGAAPKLHLQVAPMVTSGTPMSISFA